MGYFMGGLLKGRGKRGKRELGFPAFWFLRAGVMSVTWILTNAVVEPIQYVGSISGEVS